MEQRRSFLKKTSKTLPLLTGVKKQREYANTQSWELPLQDVVPRKVPLQSSGLTESEEHREATNNIVTANQSGRSEFELDAFFHGDGSLGMTGATTYGSQWRAPETGKYTLIATYWGYGGYEPGVGNLWELDIDTSVNANVNLSVMDPSDSVVAEKTVSNFGSANEEISEEVLEFLLKFLAKRLISVFFGAIGGLIAGFVLSGLEIELDLPTNNEFRIEPFDERQLKLTFRAERGKMYDVNFTPCVGFSITSREGPYQPFDPSLTANYKLTSLEIQRGTDDSSVWEPDGTDWGDVFQ